MKLIKIKIHPLFWLMGAVLLLVGNSYMFVAYIVTAVIHEYAHAFAASLFGCRTEKITLYPYGAVLYGEFETLKPSEEIAVAVAGPALNLVAALVFTALWWVFPELYAYTDILAMVNLSIGMFNLLPVYPLDGGRILMAVLKIKLGFRRAFNIVKVLGIVLMLLVIGLYVYSVFTEINYTYAVAGIFLFSSIIDSRPDNITHVMYPPGKKYLSRGVEVKTIRVISGVTPLKLLKMLSTQYYYIVEVVDDNQRLLSTIRQEDFEKLLASGGASTPIKDILGR